MTSVRVEIVLITGGNGILQNVVRVQWKSQDQRMEQNPYIDWIDNDFSFAGCGDMTWLLSCEHCGCFCRKRPQHGMHHCHSLLRCAAPGFYQHLGTAKLGFLWFLPSGSWRSCSRPEARMMVQRCVFWIIPCSRRWKTHIQRKCVLKSSLRFVMMKNAGSGVVVLGLCVFVQAETGAPVAVAGHRICLSLCSLSKLNRVVALVIPFWSWLNFHRKRNRHSESVRQNCVRQLLPWELSWHLVMLLHCMLLPLVSKLFVAALLEAVTECLKRLGIVSGDRKSHGNLLQVP